MLALGVVEFRSVPSAGVSSSSSISSSPSSSCRKAVSASTYSGDLGTIGDGALDLPVWDWLAEAGMNVDLTSWATVAMRAPIWFAASYLFIMVVGLWTHVTGRIGIS